MKKVCTLLIALLFCVPVLAEEPEDQAHQEHTEVEIPDFDDMDTDDIVAIWKEKLQQIKELEANIEELNAVSTEKNTAIQQIEGERDRYSGEVRRLEGLLQKRNAVPKSSPSSDLVDTTLIWIGGGFATGSLVNTLEEPEDDLRYFGEIGLRMFADSSVSFAVYAGKSREAVFGGMDLLLLRKGFLLGVGPFCTYDEDASAVVFPSLSLRYRLGSSLEPSVRIIMTSPHDVTAQIGLAIAI